MWAGNDIHRPLAGGPAQGLNLDRPAPQTTRIDDQAALGALGADRAPGPLQKKIISSASAA